MRYSKKRQQAETELRRIEKELDQDESNLHCFFVPAQRKSCYHHIINKSEGLQWVAIKENLLPIGTWAHDVLTFGTNEEIKKLPMIKEYLELMEFLDKDYYQRYLLKLDK